MVGGRERSGPGAHSRRGLEAQERLRSLGQQLRDTGPALSRQPVLSIPWPSARRRWWRVVAVLVLVAVVVFVAVQWLRPVPSPSFTAASPSALRLPGAAPSLPWPASGAAALTEVGVGSLGQAGATQPLPIASLAKVMVAYVVLRDHPLALGDQGPAIAVSPAVVADDQAGLASEQSELEVTDGESLSELQALQGLLLIGANDMATLLAGWDAGSASAFVAKMNTAARTLGLASVHITDASGLDPATVASASDLVRLGQAAMAIPVLTQIVGMPQATVPVAGVIYNLDNALGHDGIVGIKTGSDTKAGGCFLFEATQRVSGQPVTLLGVVLGQQGTSPTATAISAAEALLAAAFASMRPLPVVSAGATVGHVVAPWGGSVAVVAAGAPSIVSAPGLALESHVRLSSLSSIGAGTRVGSLRVVTPGRTLDVPLRTTAALPGAGIWWRLTRG